LKWTGEDRLGWSPRFVLKTSQTGTLGSSMMRLFVAGSYELGLFKAVEGRLLSSALIKAGIAGGCQLWLSSQRYSTTIFKEYLQCMIH
jgi:hypothetical protein